jgi:hypothetical protein
MFFLKYLTNIVHSYKSVIGVYMKKEKGKVTIKIPRPLYDTLSHIIEGSGFNSVTEFIVYILRDLTSSRTVEKEPSLSKKEIELVKKRLKSIGYL